ncbi:MAG: type IV pilus modification protein PilV [Halioglobus sp.]|nr:type IV pilus modification protein PilV [Halioglobus sp.]
MSAQRLKNCAETSRRVRGFTLIEVLIALLVLAIGVMGIAALQMSTYRQLQTSHNFGAAVMLASDIADRMIANSAQDLGTAYNHTAWLGEKPKNCATDTCTSAEIAEYDVNIWQQQVTGFIDDVKTPGTLPSGRGAVARVGATDNFVITVQWDDDMDGSAGTDCAALNSPPTLQDPDDLDCYALTVGL